MSVQTEAGRGAVRELPILFSGPMVRAILDGRKTMTRRVVKPQPDFASAREALGGDTSSAVVHVETKFPLALGCISLKLGAAGAPVRPYIRSPFGLPGDLLYVRETWMQAFAPTATNNGCSYLADYGHRLDLVSEEQARASWMWKPSIHMPKVAARLWLRVTDVRVERLQEITEEDARAEGAPPKPNDLKVSWGPHLCGFVDLWDSLNESRGYGWNTNPWVWRIAFERCAPTSEPTAAPSRALEER